MHMHGYLREREREGRDFGLKQGDTNYNSILSEVFIKGISY